MKIKTFTFIIFLFTACTISAQTEKALKVIYMDNENRVERMFQLDKVNNWGYDNGNICVNLSDENNLIIASENFIQFEYPSVIQPKKFLSLISVVNSWTDYSDNSWERALKVKVNKDVQIFEVCIWDILQPKVSLYQFDQTFNPYKDEYLLGGQAWVKHREQYNILDVNLTSMSSENVLDAFIKVVEKVVSTLPSEHYGIKYFGHGVGGGSLFEGKISALDANVFLNHFCNLIGRKIDFLDWNSNCELGSFAVVSNQYKYADYILASDINRGGYSFDMDAYEKYKHDQIYETFFSPNVEIRQSLIKMIDSERLFWESSKAKNDMISNSVMQSISIYDTNKFERLVSSTNLKTGIYTGDVLEYIQKNYPSEQEKFFDFRFYYTSNKDFFSWSSNTNGFSIY